MKPYIGICDVASAAEARRLAELVPYGFSHDVMIGLMMSHKTLYDVPSQWTDVFPKKEDISAIFIADPRALNTIHYADYAVGTNADRELAKTLAMVVSYGGPYLRAIQLDMIWPDPLELRKFRERFNIPIVLQVGTNAMAVCGDDPVASCERLMSYGNSVDAVLFDRSMGEGKDMDADLLAKYIGVLVADCPDLLPAVGGGIGPYSMGPVASLVAAYPKLSFDAQSKLRPSGDKKDPLDILLAERYLRQSVALFTK